MAVYEKLLRRAGGGIRCGRCRVPKNDRAALIIGLGGTGADAVCSIKRGIFDCLDPDEIIYSFPEVDKYESVGYLVIDSDDCRLSPEEPWGISDEEFLKLDVDTKSGGRASVRKIFCGQAEALYLRLKEQMVSVLANSTENAVDVYVCSGLAGETGSAILFDVCYILRIVLQDINWPKSQVVGLFFLPDVNLSTGAFSGNEDLKKVLMVNGYSALKELDYCMNFGKNKGVFETDYGFRKISSSEQPVDVCCLISATGPDGELIENGYRHSMDVVCAAVVSNMSKEMFPMRDEMTHMGLLYNRSDVQSFMSVHNGGVSAYCTLGVAELSMPYSEIETYAGAVMFDKLSNIPGKTPTVNDFLDIEDKNFPTYENLMNALTGDCKTALEWGDSFDYKLLREHGNARFVMVADEFVAENKTRRKQNMEDMLEAYYGIDCDCAKESLVGGTAKMLYYSYISSPEYGPYFARDILNGTENCSIVSIVEGMILSNEKKLEAEKAKEEALYKEVEAVTELVNPAKGGCSASGVEKYKRGLSNWYEHLNKLGIYEDMSEVLSTFRAQLLKLHENLSEFCTVFEGLKETFNLNLQDFEDGVKPVNTCTWNRIWEDGRIQDEFMTALRKQNWGSESFSKLMDVIFANGGMGEPLDEIKLRWDVSCFVFGEMHKYYKFENLDGYLPKIFGINNVYRMTNYVKKAILEPLFEKASPIFWKDIFWAGKAIEVNDFYVPYDSDIIIDAAGELLESASSVMKKSIAVDRIMVIRGIFGLQMHAFHGIYELERVYESSCFTGRHIFEDEEKNWNNLPSVIPESLLTEPSERLAQVNKALIEELEMAEKMGVVAEKNKRWFIRVTGDAPVSELRGELDACGGIDALRKLQKKVENLVEKINSDVTEFEIESWPTLMGYERTVMLDSYIMSLMLNAVVHGEVEKLRALDEIQSYICGCISKIKNDERDMVEFCEALFCGVLSFDSNIEFEVDEYGEKTKIVLQEPSMTPYGKAGAYQAFCTYQELSDKTKAMIRVYTVERINHASSEIEKACGMLNELLPAKIVESINYFKCDDKCDEISAFFTKLTKQFEIFKLMYEI